MSHSSLDTCSEGGFADGSSDEAIARALWAAIEPVPSAAKRPTLVDLDACDIVDAEATIDRYAVLEEIGRGGMGRVLRAFDPRLQRDVALKEVRPDRSSFESSLRLEIEARAMARLSHPNVVGVHDVERLDSGSVVLVMEYVPGCTLEQWLAAEERSWEEVVECFLAAGRGLVAAHEAGLLHRDFKPSNVLVADDGTVKVSDFGLAKQDGPPPSESGWPVEVTPLEGNAWEELTETGMTHGTPRYMAPEQHCGQDLGPAIDQYAFCVSLWECLCGEPPFRGAGALESKFRGPPRWPRSKVPRRVVRAIKRGLSPKPEARWSSMAALLDALSRGVRGRRRRVLLGTAGLVVAAIGLSAAIASWVGVSEQRCSGAEQQLAGVWDEERREQVESAILGVEKPFAPLAWSRTEQALDDYAAEWTRTYEEVCEPGPVRGEQPNEVMDLQMSCLRRAAAELQGTVDTLADADADVVHRAHRMTASLRPLSRCADVEAMAAEVEPPLPHEAAAVKIVRAHLARAKALRRAGKYESAREAVETARTQAARIDYGPVYTELVLEHGWVLDKLGDYEKAEALLSEALEQASRWRQWSALGDAATKLIYVVGYRQQRIEAGLRYAMVARGQTNGDPVREAAVAHSVAAVSFAGGDYDRALAEYRIARAELETVLDAEHPKLLALRNDFATVLNALGQLEEAEAELRAVLARSQVVLGPEHPDVAALRTNLALVLGSQGDHSGAEEHLRAALALYEQALGPEHPHVASAHSNLALALDAQGKIREAETETRIALVRYENVLDPEHHLLAMVRTNLATLLLDEGRPDEAVPFAERAWERRRQADIPPVQRAVTAWIYAQALWNANVTRAEQGRALELGRDALHSFGEAGEGNEGNVKAVQQWLDEHQLE